MAHALPALLINIDFPTYELLIGIIGLIIAIWGVLYIRKARFYYLEKSNIKLYEDIVKNIEGLSINYKDDEIKDNLRFYRGTVILRSWI